MRSAAAKAAKLHSSLTWPAGAMAKGKQRHRFDSYFEHDVFARSTADDQRLGDNGVLDGV